MREGKPDRADVVEARTLRVEKLTGFNNMRSGVAEIEKGMPIDMVQDNTCRAANNNEKNGEEVLFPPFDMDPEPSRRPNAIPLLVADSPRHSP